MLKLARRAARLQLRSTVLELEYLDAIDPVLDMRATYHDASGIEIRQRNSGSLFWRNEIIQRSSYMAGNPPCVSILLVVNQLQLEPHRRVLPSFRLQFFGRFGTARLFQALHVKVQVRLLPSRRSVFSH